MNRRGFLASLGALAASPALPAATERGWVGLTRWVDHNALRNMFPCGEFGSYEGVRFISTSNNSALCVGGQDSRAVNYWLPIWS